MRTNQTKDVMNFQTNAIYSGNRNVMQTTYNEPGVSLTYANGGLDGVLVGSSIIHGGLEVVRSCILLMVTTMQVHVYRQIRLYTLIQVVYENTISK